LVIRQQRTVVALALAGLVLASQAGAQPPEPAPRGAVQFGVGLLELAHAEVGVFVIPTLTIEGMLAWNGVFGSRFGAGLSYALGPASPGQPPRHALLVGARVMMASDFAFDSHGDDLSSYAITPVGYQFVARNGFLLRAAAGPVFTRERSAQGHRLQVGGPFITVSAGRWF
jgi:hypothetical protein